MSEQKQSQPSSSCDDTASWPIMICLLGNFRLLMAGALVPTRASGKNEALLAHLALQSSRRISGERLVQVLWPESDLERGRNSLRNLVHHLNKLLGPALQGATPVLHEEGYYRLNVEAGIGVDVTCFDELVIKGNQLLEAGNRAGALLSYRRAAELYRDDLGVAVDVQTVMERERLRARYLTLMAQLAEQHYRAGDYAMAQECLWRLLARDPYREDAHRLAMRCYVRRGERAAALHHYQVCADLLRAEFDAAPESATIALFQQIRDTPNEI
jgi:DNA-binding SARP family transcriptional activator